MIEIEAAWLLDRPINAEGFKAYVEKVLVATLRPGDLVIMDDLGGHKGKAVHLAIRSAGAELFFLPKSSPDLDPIEQVFAKLRHLFATPQRARSKLSLLRSASCSTPSPRRNEPTTSQTPDTGKPKNIPL